MASRRSTRVTTGAGNDTAPAGKECPACGEAVKLKARVCRYCGYRFERGLIPKVRRGYAVVGSALALAGTGTGVWATVFRGEGDGQTLDAASQVRACMSEHGLAKAQTVKESGTVKIFASCKSPAPDYASEDGYTEIRVREVDRSKFPDSGDTSEASGVGFADRIEIGECDELKAVYAFGSQGDFSYQELLLDRHDVVTVYGEPWENQPERGVFLGFYPGDDEVVVLHNSKNGLDSVRCIA